jgi:hypothetical protein
MLAFEEGTQAQWLHDLLVPHAERVIVCNVRGRSETTNKSDRIDADALSELLRRGAVKPVFHGTPEVLTLKELVRNYNNLVEDATRVMQRIKAIFRGRAIRTSGPKQWGHAFDPRCSAKLRVEFMMAFPRRLAIRTRIGVVDEAIRAQKWRKTGC